MTRGTGRKGRAVNRAGDGRQNEVSVGKKDDAIRDGLILKIEAQAERDRSTATDRDGLG